jgi:hypothetical protein
MGYREAVHRHAQWIDIFETEGDWTAIHLLDKVHLLVLPPDGDVDNCIIMIGRNPELLHEDDRLYLCFERFFAHEDWRQEIVLLNDIVKGRTAASLDRMRERLRAEGYHWAGSDALTQGEE